MKTIKVSSQPKLIKLIITGLAIATSITALQPANAQKARKRLPEIGWNSRLSSLGIDKAKNIGKTYNFLCQPATEDLVHAPIWGTNVYTANSGICSTAVHSGMISEAGGLITIEILQGQEFYTGSKKNTIKSKDHAETKLSYAFIGEALVDEQSERQSEQTANGRRNPSAIERVMVNSVQRGVERSIERVIIDIFD